MTVVGVDATRRGWVAVALDDRGHVRGHLLSRLEELDDVVGGVAAVGVDIPMGLPTAGRRRADVEARRMLGPRRASVFFTPVRAALEEPTHARATATSRARTGSGVSQQAYALRHRILEAEQWAASVAHPVWEVHPEVSFRLLLGRPARAAKTTWAGVRERQLALAGAGLDLDAVGEVGALARPDDVLDAAAAAWSTARILRGDGICLPDPPEPGADDGTSMAIRA